MYGVGSVWGEECMRWGVCGMEECMGWGVYEVRSVWGGECVG